MFRRLWMLFSLLALGLAFGACGFGSDDNGNSSDAYGWGGENGPPGGDRGEGTGDGDGDVGPGGGDPGDGDPAPGSDGSEVGGNGQGGSGVHQPVGQLTAGEWRDLDHWDFWRELVEGSWSARETAWRFDTSARFPVAVRDEGTPVRDAAVELVGAQGVVLFRARTDVNGEAELFAGLFGDEASGPFGIRVTSGDATAEAQDVEPLAAGRIDLELAGAIAPSPTLDIAFLIDTTGSMSDELRYLQAELGDVIEQVRSRQAQMNIRVGLGFYRDEGDAYVVRDFPFTEDVDDALANLAAQSTSGGGDYEEAVEQGLEAMITQGQWSDSARARLLFLVLDAPPHHTDPIVRKMQAVTQRAAELGIRVIPIAASGVDKNTEFLLRLLGIATGGTYTFLTDHSGIGNPHLEPTIGAYQVEFLNELLIRLVGEAVGE